jgi:hypothetical protein
MAIITAPFCCFAQEQQFNPEKSWVLYLALTPDSARSKNYAYHVDIDIRQYQYPLYAGYVYTLDGKHVSYKAFTPLASKALERWAHTAENYVFLAPGEGHYKIGDERFVLAASINLQINEGFVLITRRIGVRPDDTWRPVFRQLFTIDNDPMDAERIMLKVDKLYYPLNELPGKDY